VMRRALRECRLGRAAALVPLGRRPGSPQTSIDRIDVCR
jgi:hypothetical protein